MIKQLSEFDGEKGVVIAAQILNEYMVMLRDSRNEATQNAETHSQMLTQFMANSPKSMMKIFAILSEENPAEYNCNAAEAAVNIMKMANDPILRDLFFLHSPAAPAKNTSQQQPENTTGQAERQA